MLVVKGSLSFNTAWFVFPFLLVFILWLTFRSPPLAGLSLLFGSVLYGLIEPQQIGFIPRIPVISCLTIWTLLWLISWHPANFDRLTRTPVLTRLAVLLAFFGVGVFSAFHAGFLSNQVIAFYNWDLFRATFGYVLLGALCCKDQRQLRLLLLALPFVFLVYPLSLPLAIWREFFGVRIFSSSVLNVGLGFGSLNANTLGQAAATAAIIAAAAVKCFRDKHLRIMETLAFLLAALIVIMTGSRQALLGLSAGIIWISFYGSFRRILGSIALLVALMVLGAYSLNRILPGETGIRARLTEMVSDPTSWQTASYTIRMDDLQAAYQRWLSAPLLGHGFGAQRASEIRPDAQLTDIDYIVSDSLQGSHNLFLAILAQTGLCGLILWLVFYASTLRRFYRFVHADANSSTPASRFVRIAITSAVAATLLMSCISGGLGIAFAIPNLLFGAMLGSTGCRKAAIHRSISSRMLKKADNAYPVESTYHNM
jgi:O-antigen ligase